MKKYLLILLICIVALVVISMVYYVRTQAIDNMNLITYNIGNMISQKYSHMKGITIGEYKIFGNSVYTVYAYKDSNLLNDSLNKYNIGICSVTKKNKVEIVENNIFTIYEDEDEEDVRLKSSFTQIGFYDSKIDRSVIGGRIFDSRIKKIEIEFINGDINQFIINENGYFILVYNQNKIIKNKSSHYSYTDAIDKITSYDIKNKPLRKITYKHSAK